MKKISKPHTFHAFDTSDLTHQKRIQKKKKKNSLSASLSKQHFPTSSISMIISQGPGKVMFLESILWLFQEAASLRNHLALTNIHQSLLPFFYMPNIVCTTQQVLGKYLPMDSLSGPASSTYLSTGPFYCTSTATISA